jgi:hypothetical protein
MFVLVIFCLLHFESILSANTEPCHLLDTVRVGNNDTFRFEQRHMEWYDLDFVNGTVMRSERHLRVCLCRAYKRPCIRNCQHFELNSNEFFLTKLDFQSLKVLLNRFNFKILIFRLQNGSLKDPVAQSLIDLGFFCFDTVSSTFLLHTPGESIDQIVLLYVDNSV